MIILGIGAHPDDLEILAGGTLAKYDKLGHQVIMSHLLNGDKGHFHIPSKTLVRLRKREAKKAASLIGAKSIGLNIPDGELFSNLKTRKTAIDLIRSTHPDLIITHSPTDYFSDHTTTCQIVCGASFLAAAPLFKTKHKSHHLIPPIYFMDNVCGVNFLPTFYVDISETFKIKKRMLGCHQSQLKWLKEHDQIDMLETIETVAKFRGLDCKAKYAEGFREYEVWGRRVARRLLP